VQRAAGDHAGPLQHWISERVKRTVRCVASANLAQPNA
jgi:hypothetical protein